VIVDEELGQALELRRGGGGSEQLLIDAGLVQVGHRNRKAALAILEQPGKRNSTMSPTMGNTTHNT
jgi:hypothetical protein